MLNIKLPKGKVARALMDCADAYAASVEVECIAYHKDLEVWRKNRSGPRRGTLGQINYPPSAPNSTTKDKALKFMEMAAACTHSTGDVYVSAELWAEIKGYYEV